MSKIRKPLLPRSSNEKGEKFSKVDEVVNALEGKNHTLKLLTVQIEETLHTKIKTISAKTKKPIRHYVENFIRGLEE